jgi:hypothetical protein
MHRRVSSNKGGALALSPFPQTACHSISLARQKTRKMRVWKFQDATFVTRRGRGTYEQLATLLGGSLSR